MGSDASKPAVTRKRSGISNVFSGGGCQRSAGETKSARGSTTTTPSVSGGSEAPLRVIPSTPVNCKPGRLKPPAADAAISFMADLEYVLTCRLLAEGLPRVVTRSNSTNSKSVNSRSLTSSTSAARTVAAPMSGEVVRLPANRSTGLPMASTAETRAMLGSAAGGRDPTRSKESGGERASATQGLTVTSGSATESPRIVCEELIDVSCVSKTQKEKGTANTNTVTVPSASNGTRSQQNAATDEPVVSADGLPCMQTVVGDVYFEALRAAWSAPPPPHSEAAARAAKLPPLAATSEVGAPVDILHTVNHQTASYPLFKKPIPLGYMIELLRPRWEDEGLYEQVEEQERYAQVEAARRAKHRRAP